MDRRTDTQHIRKGNTTGGALCKGLLQESKLEAKILKMTCVEKQIFVKDQLSEICQTGSRKQDNQRWLFNNVLFQSRF